MKQILTGCLVVLTFACLATLVRAADKPAEALLTGTWQCQSHGGSRGEMSFTLDLQQNGEDVTGSVSSPLGDADIASGSFKGHHCVFKIKAAKRDIFLPANIKKGRLWVAGTKRKLARKGPGKGRSRRIIN